MLSILFGGLLSITFLEQDYFYFTWIAFIPILFAIENSSLKRTYFISLIGSCVGFVLATYWLYAYIITAKGLGASQSWLLSAATWFFSAQVLAVIMLVFQWLKQATKVHEFILFPIVVATGTAVFPMIFGVRLGESQVNFLYALQAIEFVGVHGLDAIIALFNIMAFRFFHTLATGNNKPKTLKTTYRATLRTTFGKTFKTVPWVLAASIIGLWFLYGIISYSSWNTRVDEWNTIKIGLIQPNENPILGKSIHYPGYSKAYPPEMEMTTRLSLAGAELIIWPEAQPKDYLNNSHIKTAYSHSIQDIGTSLLFQDALSLTKRGQAQKKQDKKELDRKKYNMAVMLNGQGKETGRYKKIKRIPFGEYIPFAENSEYIQAKTRKFFGKNLRELNKGEQHQLFKHQMINIIPLICYETTFSNFVASAVKKTADLANKANGTLLVGLSNDGWFRSVHQANLHVLASNLRAIENRLPLVHAVNNGPSIVVTPSGKRIFTTEYQQAGGYLVDVPHSSEANGSFYSRHPNLFQTLLYICMLFFMAFANWNKVKAE